MLFIRKINKNVWIQTLVEAKKKAYYPSRIINDISSSRDDDISIWKIDPLLQAGRENIALIMANLDTMKHPIDFLPIAETTLNNLKRKGLDYKQENSTIELLDCKAQHHNIKNLTYKTLGVVAENFMEALKIERNKDKDLTKYRFTANKILGIAKERIEQNLLTVDELNPNGWLYKSLSQTPQCKD